MYYKLSNTSNIDDMETLFGSPFKYPNLHQKSVMINGLDEQSLPIITDSDTKQIQYGIWGILPQDFKEDWQVFQNAQNTLNLSLSDIENSNMFSVERRCVAIVSGFFKTYIHDGELYPFYIYPKSRKPFAIAGIYNITNDGYITFSLLLAKQNLKTPNCKNLGNIVPVALASNHYQKWLSEDFQQLLENNNSNIDLLNFQCHPIAKEFYKNDILFDSLLDSTDYESLAILF